MIHIEARATTTPFTVHVHQESDLLPLDPPEIVENVDRSSQISHGRDSERPAVQPNGALGTALKNSSTNPG